MHLSPADLRAHDPLWGLETQRWLRLPSRKSGKVGAPSAEIVANRPFSKAHVGIYKNTDGIFAYVLVICI